MPRKHSILPQPKNDNSVGPRTRHINIKLQQQKMNFKPSKQLVKDNLFNAETIDTINEKDQNLLDLKKTSIQELGNMSFRIILRGSCSLRHRQVQNDTSTGASSFIDLKKRVKGDYLSNYFHEKKSFTLEEIRFFEKTYNSVLFDHSIKKSTSNQADLSILKTRKFKTYCPQPISSPITFSDTEKDEVLQIVKTLTGFSRIGLESVSRFIENISKHLTFTQFKEFVKKDPSLFINLMESSGIHGR